MSRENRQLIKDSREVQAVSCRPRVRSVVCTVESLKAQAGGTTVFYNTQHSPTRQAVKLRARVQKEKGTLCAKSYNHFIMLMIKNKITKLKKLK